MLIAVTSDSMTAPETNPFTSTLADAITDVLAFPASVPQQMFWYLESLQGEVTAFNVPLRYRLTGPLDILLLERSLNTIIDRHESLRSYFCEDDGEPLQFVTPKMELEIPVIDISHFQSDLIQQEADRLGTLEARRSFHLSTGPLIRAELIRCSPHDHVFHLTIHHSVFDGMSMTVLTRELAVIYQAYSEEKPCPLEPLTLQYGDFSVWQKEYLQGPEIKRQLAYWKKRLAGMTELNLPTEFPRPRVKSWKGTITSVLLPNELTDQLHEFATQNGSTLFHLQLAAYLILLHRYTNCTDIAVGVPVSGRTRPELEPLIGVFINSVILRCNLAGMKNFSEFLAHVKESVLEAMENQELPFEHLVRELQPNRNPGSNPLFQLNFNHHRSFSEAGTFGGVTLTPIPSISPGSIFDLHFFMVERKEGWRASCEFSNDLFSKRSADRMLGHFKHLLEEIAATPEKPLAELDILTDIEKRELAQWSHPKGSTKSKYILDALLRPVPVCIPGTLWESASGDSHIDVESIDHPTIGKLITTHTTARFTSDGTIEIIENSEPKTPTASKPAAYSPLQSPTPEKAGASTTPSIESKITKIWQDLLGLPNIGHNDDFFALGGHSLMSLRMFSRIKREFGKTLPLAVLIDHPTIARLAELLASEKLESINESSSTEEPSVTTEPAPMDVVDEKGHIVTLSKGGNQPPLFCIHGGDGGVIFYRGLAQKLPKDIPIHAIQSLELENSGAIASVSIEDTAAGYIRSMMRIKPNGPFRLAGYSFGGVVAHEMACQLIDQGHEVEFLGMFDTQSPTARSRKYRLLERLNVFWKQSKELPTHRRIGQLRARICEGVHTNHKIREELKEAAKSGPADAYSDLRRIQVREENWRAMQAYQPRPYKGRITLFKTTYINDKIKYPADYGWSQVALSGLDIVSVSGHHLALFAPENIDLLAEGLTSSLQLAKQRSS